MQKTKKLLGFVKKNLLTKKVNILLLFSFIVCFSALFVLSGFLNPILDKIEKEKEINITKENILKVTKWNSRNFLKLLDSETRTFGYNEYKEIKEIIWDDWNVSYSFFIRIPTMWKANVFWKKLQSDLMLMAYDYNYIWIENKNNEKLPISISKEAILVLKELLKWNSDERLWLALNNSDTINLSILNMLDMSIIFWKSSIYKDLSLDWKEKEYKIHFAWISNKLPIYALAIPLDKAKYIYEYMYDKNFEENIDLNEIQIKINNDNEFLIKKYKEELSSIWYTIKETLDNKDNGNEIEQTINILLISITWIVWLLLLTLLVLNIKYSILISKKDINIMNLLWIDRKIIFSIYFIENLIVIVSWIIISTLITFWVYKVMEHIVVNSEWRLAIYTENNISNLFVLNYEYILIFSILIICINLILLINNVNSELQKQ